MIRSDDPARDYSRLDYEQYKYEQRCPVCNDCGDPITEEKYWEFHGIYYCEQCVGEHGHYVEEYINN